MGTLTEHIAEQRAERRRQVLLTARKLIRRRGIDRVTMRALASESQISVPTLYKFFGDKEQLLSEAVTGGFCELLEARPARGVERIFGLLHVCATQPLRASRYERSLFRSFLDPWKPGNLRDRFLRVLGTRFYGALSDLQKDGDLAPDVRIAPLVELLVGHCGVTTLRWMAGELPEDQLGPKFYEGATVILLGAVEPRARASVRARIDGCVQRLSELPVPPPDPSFPTPTPLNTEALR